MATAKNRYTATFADGYVATRGTDRSYSHAWRVVGPNLDVVGFASTQALAERAAAAYANGAAGVSDFTRYTVRTGSKGIGFARFAASVVRDNGGIDAYRAKVEAARKQFSIEVVPAVPA